MSVCGIVYWYIPKNNIPTPPKSMAYRTNEANRIATLWLFESPVVPMANATTTHSAYAIRLNPAGCPYGSHSAYSPASPEAMTSVLIVIPINYAFLPCGL